MWNFPGALKALVQGGDVDVLLQFKESNRGLLKKIPSRYVLGTGKAAKIQPIYGRLPGAWADWSLKMLPARKIPAKVQTELHRSAH